MEDAPRQVRGARFGIPDEFTCYMRGDILVVYDAESDLYLTFDTARHPANEIAVAFGLYLFGAHGQHAPSNLVGTYSPPG